MNDYTAMNAIYEKGVHEYQPFFQGNVIHFLCLAFADAKPYPARSAVAVSALPRGALVEIEVIAVKPN
jgi:enamine deaminase RidA (YjgF/YER057c/UK114 family)